MRFHERPLNLRFKKIKRPEKVNAIDALCRSEVPDSGIERDDFNGNFDEVPQLFTAEERQQWLKQLDNVAVSSDAFVSTLSLGIDCDTDDSSFHSRTTSIGSGRVVSSLSQLPWVSASI